MKQIAKRMTYANVMSTIAVFLVLGGATAVAATTLGKDSVGAKQLQANAVTSAKLKNGAVTGAKIKNGAVTGPKIDLSTIGTVPSATDATNANHAASADNATDAGHAGTADNATNATHAETATNATNFSRYINTGLVKAALGETVTVASVGPFTVSGECADESGEPAATVFLTTTSPGSSESGYEEQFNRENFNPGTKAEITFPVNNGFRPKLNEPYGGYYTGFDAITKTGSTIISGAVDNAVNIDGAACAFFGHVLDES